MISFLDQSQSLVRQSDIFVLQLNSFFSIIQLGLQIPELCPVITDRIHSLQFSNLFSLFCLLHFVTSNRTVENGKLESKSNSTCFYPIILLHIKTIFLALKLVRTNDTQIWKITRL